MQNAQVPIDAEMQQAMQSLFPFRISESDLPYVVDLFLTLGMAAVKTVLAKHPELTIGDLITMFYKLQND